jgi:hypothetical protein
MKKKIGIIAALLVVVALSLPLVSAPAVVANGGVQAQLAMILDGSGSIGSGSWNIMLNGLAAAVNNTQCIPHDGTVELTVIQFSTDAALEVGPVVITDANADDVADDIMNIIQMGGTTCISCGFCLAADELHNSPNFDPSLKQAINLVTDGDPNECSCYDGDCNYNAGTCSSTDPSLSAECALNYTLALLGMTEDQDEIDAEFIGTQGTSSDWLRDDVVWPQPGYYLDPPATNWTGPGWVRVVTDAQEFADTLCEKCQAILEIIPAVGGTAYPVNKLIILLPWMALGAAIIAGIAILERRRRAHS